MPSGGEERAASSRAGYPPPMAHAAARFGAFGFAEKPNRVTLYSSVPLKSYKDEEDEQTPLKQTDRSVDAKPSKRYGIPLINQETVHERYKRRRYLCDRRIKISDWSLYLALTGLGLAIIDVELSAAWTDSVQKVSHFLRGVIIMTTVLLDTLVVVYHWTEVAIISADTGHVILGMSTSRKLKMVVELLVCSLCPWPSSGHVNWPVLSESLIVLTVPVDGSAFYDNTGVLEDSGIQKSLTTSLTQSECFGERIEDAATRAIASFNRVSVDFPFVLKTLICNQPLTFVLSVSITFWACSSWLMTQCERYVSDNSYSTVHYLPDYAWFEAVTFFAIGYGDLQVETYCGRSLAILTGIVGSVFSSLITVLVSQRMLLSLAEKRVNQVIAESQLVSQHKNAAAKVLQCTWKVVRWQRRLDELGGETKTNIFHLRMAQRHLLQSVIEFRRCRWKLRLRQEEEDDAITIRRAFTETEERLRLLRTRQQQVAVHLQGLTTKVDRLSLAFRARPRIRSVVAHSPASAYQAWHF